jgi:methylenetetrahydrofolate dehydrogenase (NADP+) / methenyltetrahydrofolate cyclohydrolase
MNAKIIDGIAIANGIKEQVLDGVQLRLDKKLNPPGLAVVMVGENPASKVYVAHKKKACEAVGITSKTVNFDIETTQHEVIKIIKQLNENPCIHGILVQQPLPEHYDLPKIIQTIDPHKDVDGFHPLNIGHLALRHPKLRPCTPKGIITLLEKTHEDLHGMHVCIVGASNIVGRPMALECLLAGCTITVCHRFTENLEGFTKQADIIIAAVGKPKFITKNMVKPGATVIDVGITRLDDGSLSGDVDFEEVKKVAGHITPVPGGVGPMTVAILLKNTLDAANKISK